MVEKTCMNCRWEPRWSEWVGPPKFAHRSGHCNYPITVYIPWAALFTKETLVHYRDPTSKDPCERPNKCPCWELKPQPREFVPDDYSLAS